MQSILIFGAGKSATILIDFLANKSHDNTFKLSVADSNKSLLDEKLGKHNHVNKIYLDITNTKERNELIAQQQVVISLLPPQLHYLVATDCLEYNVHLITASYIDDFAKSIDEKVKSKNLLFLYEMGLDPGIDHMSAMKILDELNDKNAEIDSFKSHCGALVSEANTDNALKYKISWNPANVVNAGKSGAIYFDEKQVKKIWYDKMFKNCKKITIEEYNNLEWYPNRDSISYMPIYKIKNVNTFLRTTLRYKGFSKKWRELIDLEFTDYDKKYNNTTVNEILLDNILFEKGLLLTEYLEKKPFMEALFEELDLRNDTEKITTEISLGNILQSRMEKYYGMETTDTDRVVMIHEIEFFADKKEQKITSILDINGDDYVHTALAKTVGLPLGIMALELLKNKTTVTGVQIPIHKEIYEAVLPELEKMGIKFTETITDK